MRYNPLKEFTPSDGIAKKPSWKIERRPDEEGEHWGFHCSLIQNLLSHYDEVESCIVDIDGEIVYITLARNMYDVEELQSIDRQLRQTIGKIATFAYMS